MSLNGIINTSLSGLFTNQTAMSVTANNIANVNTPGFSRLKIEQEANVVQGESAGVKLAGVTRVVDTFLETAHRTATSNASEFEIERQFHDRVQGLLGRPDSKSSLSGRMNQFFSSIADLSLNPADVLRRQQTLSQVQSYLDQASLMQSEIQILRADASEQIKEKTSDANDQLQRIFELNPLLAKQKALGEETGGLSGQLTVALEKLSRIIDVKVQDLPDGRVRVSTASGVTLVDETLSQLSYDAPGIVTSGTFFPSIQLSRVNPDTLEEEGQPRDINGHIRSGEMRGLIEIRDTQLRDLSVTLGELTANVMDELNSIHNAYSAVPAPNSMAGRQTAIDATHAPNFTGVVNFAVTDSSNQLVAKHTIDFDSSPPASYTALISAVNAGLGGAATLSLTNGKMDFTAANSTHGVVIADDETTPSSNAGRGFSHFFGMNDMVSAEEQGIYETGFKGTDAHNMTAGDEVTFRVLSKDNAVLTTVAVPVTGTTFDDMVTELNNVTGLGAYVSFTLDANGKLDWESNGAVDGVRLKLVSDNTELGSTGLGFSKTFGMDDKYRVDAASHAKVKDAITRDPSLLALSAFDHSAVAGDVAITTGDQRGALALQNLETQLVGFSDAGELRATRVTLTQYTSQFLGNAGLMSKRASSLEEDNIALKNELDQRRADVSGVNLDEELANLVVYQNAYSAAARVLSSVQEIYDDLLQIV